MVHREAKLLESAIAVAEELSFSRAARKERLSQPTITRNVSILEKKLGTELFERNRRRVFGIRFAAFRLHRRENGGRFQECCD